MVAGQGLALRWLFQCQRYEQKKRPYYRAKAIWPAIISEDDVAALRAEQQRRLGGHAISYAHRFSLCVYCAICGHRMAYQYKAVRYKDNIYHRENCRCPTGDHPHKFCSARKIRDALTVAIEVLVDESTITQLTTDTSGPRQTPFSRPNPRPAWLV